MRTYHYEYGTYCGESQTFYLLTGPGGHVYRRNNDWKESKKAG